MQLFRQGDVLVREVSKIPSETNQDKKNGSVVLALGESTGHSHQIHRGATMFMEGRSGGSRFIAIGEKGADLVHEEHSTIHLPPGNFQVTIQAEYQPGPVPSRSVED